MGSEVLTSVTTFEEAIVSETFPIDDVVVTGQRARGPSPFAELQFPTKGTGTTGEQQQEVGDGTEQPGTPSDEEIQCSTPEGSKQWNADAKANEAANQFLNKAGQDHNEPDWENREFGALICEFADGSIALGPIISGEPRLAPDGTQLLYYDANGDVRNPGVAIPREGCGSSGTPLGFVHTHFAGASGHPSDADFDYAQQLVDYFGAPADASVYVVAKYQDAETGEVAVKVSHSKVTEKETARQGGDPNWVDPDATPCPGDA